ncbi:MAG: DUF5666 domain-containing protein [candidate division KSB1 bacterium]|nr:DUF5666 domain-containing protein [candidate division KSB1 bacterium]MDZ7302428.1 DUF5666 domain-containing protein [candidate division KSB1 bacterium]MDZ7311630.1 DUF5666 domain-containing protein [candidate division KSB1 bacterium]
MVTKVKFIVVVFAALFLAAAKSGETQVAVQKTAADLFKTLKPGQWVELEGTVQKDYTVLTKKVKLLTGDFQDDDWEIKAAVRTIDKAKKQFQVLLLPVVTSQETEYENDAGTFKSFDQLKVGMLVECEGTYLKDGTFAAEEVQEETDYEPNELHELRAVGKVEKIDPEKRTVKMVGVTFKIIESTKVQSALK